MTIEELKVKITADTAGLKSQVSGVKAKLGELSKETKSTSSSMSQSFGLVKGAVAALAASLVALGIKSVKSAAAMEQTLTQFTTFLKDAGRAQKLMRELQAFAATTPFEFTEIADTAKAMLGAGVAANQVTGYLQVLGDVASGSGADLNELARIFLKVKSKGKLTSEELESFNTKLVPILKGLSSSLGKTEVEIRKMMETGEITFDTMVGGFKAMTSQSGLFYNSMVNQSKTLAGMWSNFGDSIGQSAVHLGNILIAVLGVKSILPSVTAQINKFNEAMNNTSQEKLNTGLAVFQSIMLSIIVVGAIILLANSKLTKTILLQNRLLKEQITLKKILAKEDTGVIFKSIFGKYKEGVDSQLLKGKDISKVPQFIQRILTGFSKLPGILTKSHTPLKSISSGIDKVLISGNFASLGIKAGFIKMGVAIKSAAGSVKVFTASLWKATAAAAPWLALVAAISAIVYSISVFTRAKKEFNDEQAASSKSVSGETVKASKDIIELTTNIEKAKKELAQLQKVSQLGLAGFDEINQLAGESQRDIAVNLKQSEIDAMQAKLDELNLKVEVEPQLVEKKGWLQRIDEGAKEGWKLIFKADNPFRAWWDGFMAMINPSALFEIMGKGIKKAWTSGGDNATNWWSGFTTKIKDTANKWTLSIYNLTESGKTKGKEWWNGFKSIFSKESFSSLFQGIGNTFTEMINGIIRGLNTISIKIPSWVPKFGGNIFGFNIKEIPIPKLAEGGVINSGRLVYAGEAGKEAIVPLENNTGWIDNLAKKINGTGGKPTEINLTIGDTKFAKFIISEINKQQRVEGKLLLSV